MSSEKEERQFQETFERVTTMMSSVKEVTAASFRCPELFQSFVEKHLAYDQRDTLQKFNQQFKERLIDPAAPPSPLLRKVSYRRNKETKTTSPPTNGMDSTTGRGDHQSSPPSSPLVSPRAAASGAMSPIAESLPAESRSSGVASPSAEIGGGDSFGGSRQRLNSGSGALDSPRNGRRSSAFGGSGPTGGGGGVCWRAYKEALLGVADAPDEPEMEAYPQPLKPGLLHGETKLLEKFFRSYPKVLEFLSERFEKDHDTYDTISEINMLWVGKHPMDYEFSGRENAKWVALSETSGSGAKRKDLGQKMRHLLLLNLQLHHSSNSEEWVELLSVRDKVCDVLHKAVDETPLANSEVEDAVNQMELACTALELLRIDSKPEEVREIILLKAGNVVKALENVFTSGSGASSGGFFRSMTAEGQQLKSVINMLKRVQSDIREELGRIEKSE